MHGRLLGERSDQHLRAMASDGATGQRPKTKHTMNLNLLGEKSRPHAAYTKSHQLVEKN
jgi:hypothetical protein